MAIKKITDLISLQEFYGLSSTGYDSIKNSMAPETLYTLIDERDGKEYKIALLNDDRIWMCQNLAIGGDTEMVLTPNDTDIESNFTLPKSDLGSMQNILNNNFAYVYDLGGLYSYYTATAGRTNSDTGDATHSIAPRGWSIPNKSEMDGLIAAYNNNTNGELFGVPGFALAGFVSGKGELADSGSRGHYGSATAYSDNMLERYHIKKDGGYDQGHTSRVFGIAYRCVARVPSTGGGMTISDLVYLQDLARLTQDEYNAVVDSMTEETTYTLKDQRDNKPYKVAKLPDGRVWMVENLKLDGGTVCTPRLSDTVDRYILPSDDKNGFTNVDGIEAMCSENDIYYYSWKTVTAGTGTTSFAEGNARRSIAPRGWRLPTSTEYAFLADLYSESDSGGLQKTPAPGFTLDGYIFYTTVTSKDTEGLYWSSSTTSTGIEFLQIKSSATNPQNTLDDTKRGLTARFVLRTYEEMSDFASRGIFYVGNTENVPKFILPQNFYYGNGTKHVRMRAVGYSSSENTLYLVEDTDQTE